MDSTPANVLKFRSKVLDQDFTLLRTSKRFLLKRYFNEQKSIKEIHRKDYQKYGSNTTLTSFTMVGNSTRSKFIIIADKAISIDVSDTDDSLTDLCLITA